MKDFIVIGLGNFGHHVAIELASKGHQILAIDIDPDKVQNIKNFVSDAIIADCKNKNVLKEFVSKRVSAAVVCIGQNLESSILTTHHLKELGVKEIIVKAINHDHAELVKIMGATEIIFPERDMAIRLAQRLASPNLLEHIPLTSDFNIVEYAVPDSLVGKTLKDIRFRSKYDILIIAVKDILRDKYTLMPDANYKIMPDSLFVLMGKNESFKNFENQI